MNELHRPDLFDRIIGTGPVARRRRVSVRNRDGDDPRRFRDLDCRHSRGSHDAGRPGIFRRRRPVAIISNCVWHTPASGNKPSTPCLISPSSAQARLAWPRHRRQAARSSYVCSKGRVVNPAAFSDGHVFSRRRIYWRSAVAAREPARKPTRHEALAPPARGGYIRLISVWKSRFSQSRGGAGGAEKTFYSRFERRCPGTTKPHRDRREGATIFRMPSASGEDRPHVSHFTRNRIRTIARTPIVGANWRPKRRSISIATAWQRHDRTSRGARRSISHWVSPTSRIASKKVQ